jgi:hypothetical protein
MYTVQVHRYFPAGNNHGDHEAVLLSDSPDDTHFALCTKLVEHSAQCGHLVATRQELDAGRNREIAGGPFHRRRGTSRNPRVYQKKDTHREPEYQRADKQAKVQMKIANDGVESSHGLDQSLYTAAGSAWRLTALR